MVIDWASDIPIITGRIGPFSSLDKNKTNPDLVKEISNIRILYIINHLSKTLLKYTL